MHPEALSRKFPKRSGSALGGRLSDIVASMNHLARLDKAWPSTALKKLKNCVGHAHSSMHEIRQAIDRHAVAHKDAGTPCAYRWVLTTLHENHIEI